MSQFTPFEAKALRFLCSRVLTSDLIDAVIADATPVSYEYTGAGYFFTVSHPALPQERIVCSQPILMGRSAYIDCGFVIFLEQREMTLECHSWGETEVPEDFRSRDVTVEVAKNVIT